MKLKIYIMHSEKTDYKNILYKPLLESNIGKENLLILPMSKRFESTYIKDLLQDSDIVICDLTNSNFFLKTEIKYANKLNKKVYYYINMNDKNKKKYKDYIEYSDTEDFINKVNNLINSLNKKEIILKRDNIYTLGKLNID